LFSYVATLEIRLGSGVHTDSWSPELKTLPAPESDTAMFLYFQGFTLDLSRVRQGMNLS